MDGVDGGVRGLVSQLAHDKGGATGEQQYGPLDESCGPDRRTTSAAAGVARGPLPRACPAPRMAPSTAPVAAP